jgi:hypothetical protein
MTTNQPATNASFRITLFFDQTPSEVFNAINKVKEWWGEGIQGSAENTCDEFTYRHKDLHYSVQKITEVIPEQKVVWLVTDSRLSFIEKQEEWVGTKIIFDITREADKTKLVFTHQGLVPQCACFEACCGGWNYYVNESLVKLITTGKGEPDDKSIGENSNN